MRKRSKVLVVESESELRRYLLKALEVHGYPCAEASTAEEGLDILRRETIPIAVTDVFLRGTNGIELLKRIREGGTDCEVILTALGAPIQTVVAALRDHGAFDFLEKPIDIDSFLLAVGRAEEKVRLAHENRALRRATGLNDKVPDLVASSPPMREVINTAEVVAPTDLAVLIEGESGTGKELIANLVHRKSGRSDMPFIAINCGVLQESLLESELFGHEKGAFTGAYADHRGLFEIADHGSLFLDEVGEMSVDLQVKLLRVLETNEFRRVGGHRLIRVDVRLIAATNKRLADEVKRGRFREDLFYRLNVVRIELAPLRQRPEDIRGLVQAFLERHQRRGMPPRHFSDDAIAVLERYPWPGNVRELENLVDRTLILTPREAIVPSDFPPQVLLAGGGPAEVPEDGPPLPLAEIERQHILRSLQRNKGNKLRTARELQINVKTLYNKLRSYRVQDAWPPPV